jgi:hypothetical protein
VLWLRLGWLIGCVLTDDMRKWDEWKLSGVTHDGRKGKGGGNRNGRDEQRLGVTSLDFWCWKIPGCSSRPKPIWPIRSFEILVISSGRDEQHDGKKL